MQNIQQITSWKQRWYELQYKWNQIYESFQKQTHTTLQLTQHVLNMSKKTNHFMDFIDQLISQLFINQKSSFKD